MRRHHKTRNEREKVKEDWLKIFWVLSLMVLLSVVEAKAAAEEKEEPKGLSGAVTPVFSYVTIDKDEKKFREDWWLDDQWSGGVDEFVLKHSQRDLSIFVEGSAIFSNKDYDLFMRINKAGLGYIHGGYTQYRKYFDDTGGFFSPFAITHFDLDKDLYLNIGNFFIDAGLNAPGLPEIAVGYEHRFKDGDKTLTSWGSVTEGDISRKIFPTFKDIDEKWDILKVQINHDIGWVHLGNDFRYEHLETDTIRLEQDRNPDENTSKTVTVFEEYSHNAFYNTFRADSHVTDKCYLALGYLFNSVDGTSDFRINTAPFDSNFDRNWFTRAVDVEQKSHVVNTNLLFGPWKDFVFYGGLQIETTEKDGDTDAVLNEIRPGADVISPEAGIVSRTDKTGFQETAGTRYKGIPYTTIYAEGKWTQQDIDLFERQIEDGEPDFVRFTDTDAGRRRYTIGFNTSPISRTTLSAHYRSNVRNNEYDHPLNTEQDSYPALIRDQELKTDEISAKISCRPTWRLRTSLQYRLVSTEIDTSKETDPLGSVESGSYDANIYSASVTWTPLSRFYLMGLFSYQDVRARSFNNAVDSVVSYDGDVYSFTGSAVYAIDDKTDMEFEYIYSRSDNFKDNSAFGLPLLLDNERHGLFSCFSRRINENMEIQLRYGYYSYREESNDGADDYTAHLFGVGWKFGF
jgi:hypothetical protein